MTIFSYTDKSILTKTENISLTWHMTKIKKFKKIQKIKVRGREAFTLLHSDKKLVWDSFHYIQRNHLRPGIIFFSINEIHDNN